jgi:hypothetical protein
MNGVGQMQPNVENNMENVMNQSNPREKVLTAVNTLIKLDEKFPDNIEKLAKLIQEKPAIYQMAVQYLNSL